jgi:hypothetical protein
VHPALQTQDLRSCFRSASSLSGAEGLIRVTLFLWKPCVLSPLGRCLLRGLGLVQTRVTLGGVKRWATLAGRSCSAIIYGRNNAAVHRKKCYPGSERLEPGRGLCRLGPCGLEAIPWVVCQVRSTLRASVGPLPLLIAGCVLPEDHGGEAHLPVRQESGFPRRPGSNPGNTWRCKALGHFGGKVLFCHHLRPEQRRRPSKKVLPWL